MLGFVEVGSFRWGREALRELVAFLALFAPVIRRCNRPSRSRGSGLYHFLSDTFEDTVDGHANGALIAGTVAVVVAAHHLLICAALARALKTFAATARVLGPPQAALADAALFGVEAGSATPHFARDAWLSGAHDGRVGFVDVTAELNQP